MKKDKGYSNGIRTAYNVLAKVNHAKVNFSLNGKMKKKKKKKKSKERYVIRKLKEETNRIIKRLNRYDGRKRKSMTKNCRMRSEKEGKEGGRERLIISFVINSRIMSHSPSTPDISAMHIEEDNPVLIMDGSIEIAKKMLADMRKEGKDELDVEVIILVDRINRLIVDRDAMEKIMREVCVKKNRSNKRINK